ncbi:MAG TPA: FAD-dependent oxidoreductase, partial [Candidatus Limnocylindria bacterium]|nr:FAD-dependent oxidoreductase [Candidatus Limnocylindria bacterium]
TVFEALHLPGGVLTYGIPEFRLPKAIVMAEVDALRRLGVEIQVNTIIGKTVTVDELFAQGFEAVFIASGAGLPRFMGIPGESLKGVYSANEYLTRVNLMKAYEKDSLTPVMRGRRVAVVGGGNVAMDAARCAKRLGAQEVTIVYRRGMAELPARLEEIHHAQEEGILFRLLTSPVRVLGDENRWVRGLECLRMTLGEPDASGRRRPVEEAGSNFEVPCDVAVIAIGTSSNPLIRMTTPGLDTDKWGCIVVNGKDGLTSRPRVDAGGDAVTGSATGLLAMGAGKDAARAIDRELRPQAQT